MVSESDLKFEMTVITLTTRGVTICVLALSEDGTALTILLLLQLICAILSLWMESTYPLKKAETMVTTLTLEMAAQMLEQLRINGSEKTTCC